MVMEAFNFVLFGEREKCSMSQEKATINNSGHLVCKVFAASSVHCSWIEKAAATAVELCEQTGCRGSA